MSSPIGTTSPVKHDDGPLPPYEGIVTTQQGQITYDVGRFEADEFILECEHDPDVLDYLLFDGEYLVYDALFGWWRADPDVEFDDSDSVTF